MYNKFIRGCIGMILDLFGYIRRNHIKWSRRDKEKAYKEIMRIASFLEKELNLKGDVNRAG